MSDQKPPLPGSDPIQWLLAGDDPSVRFFTLTDLLGSSPDSPEAVAARREIMLRGAVPRILDAQGDDGHWEGPDRFYVAKYRGTVWTLIILAELGADGGDERVRRGCEAVLRDAQDRESGGFSTNRSKTTGGGLRSRVVPCLTGNVVWSLIRLGLLDDPRVQAGIDWLTTFMRFDDGDGETLPAGPTTPGRCAGDATPAPWALSRRSKRWRRYRRSAGRSRSAARSTTASRSCSPTTCTSAATTWRATRSPVGGAWAFR